METHIVIMAGGIGSRFWPMSTPECPKQFIDMSFHNTYALYFFLYSRYHWYILCTPSSMSIL